MVQIYSKKGYINQLDTVVFVVEDNIAKEFENNPNVVKIENKQLLRIIEAIKISEYNKKPERFYELIESWFPRSKYIELFARNKRRNWTSWGNEI